MDHVRGCTVDAHQGIVRRRTGSRRRDVLGAVERRWDFIGCVANGTGSGEDEVEASEETEKIHNEGAKKTKTFPSTPPSPLPLLRSLPPREQPQPNDTH